MPRFFEIKERKVPGFKFREDLTPPWFVLAIAAKLVTSYDTHAEFHGDDRNYMLFPGDFVVLVGREIMNFDEAKHLRVFREIDEDGQNIIKTNQYN